VPNEPPPIIATLAMGECYRRKSKPD